MVPAHSHEISRASCYSGYSHVSFRFVYRTFTFYGSIFQKILLQSLNQLRCPNPNHITVSGLGSSDFARHYFRNRFYFLFLRVIRCFSSPGSLHYAMYLRNDTITLLMVSSLIRISTDLCSFATPRSFSQLVTSFFGAMCQGILLYALCSLIFLSFAFFSNPSNLLSSLTYTRLYYFVNRSYVLFFFRINLFI